jgi:hypothetical protein
MFSSGGQVAHAELQNTRIPVGPRKGSRPKTFSSGPLTMARTNECPFSNRATSCPRPQVDDEQVGVLALGLEPTRGRRASTSTGRPSKAACRFSMPVVSLSGNFTSLRLAGASPCGAETPVDVESPPYARRNHNDHTCPGAKHHV